MSQKSITFSIGRKLLLLFGGICLGFFILVGIVIWQLSNVNEQLAAMSDYQLPALRKSSEIKSSIFRQDETLDEFFENIATGNLTAGQSAKNEFVLAGQPATLLLGNSEEARALRSFTKNILDRETRQGHLDEKDKTILDLDQISANHAEYSRLALSLFTMDPSSARFQETRRQAHEAIEKLMQSMIQFDQQIVQFVHDNAAELSAHSKQILLIVSVGVVLIFLIALWITLALVGKMTSPLGHLTKIASSIASSDLSNQVEKTPTGDELEILADSFREMSGNLRGQIEEMRQGIETLGTAINEIGASIQEQAASAKEEAATIQEITTTMQEIQQSGTEISQRAKDVSASAEITLSAGEEGLAAVSKTFDSMERIREQVEEVAEKIVSLSEKTQAIGEITATVNEIAEQSNILAINAAIEAASAGESGGRFSVVAQEMKHLADQAKTSTKMVRGILEEIQKGINTSVMLTEEAVKRTDSGRAQAGIAQGNIHKLTDSIQTNVQTFQQIIAGNGQQQIGINQVVQGMQDIKQAVQQTVTGISQLEQATRSLNEMSQSLRNLVGRYKL